MGGFITFGVVLRVRFFYGLRLVGRTVPVDVLQEFTRGTAHTIRGSLSTSRSALRAQRETEKK